MDLQRNPSPPRDEVIAWLGGRHGVAIEAFSPLEGGFWSSAWSYRAGDDELVLRLGQDGDGFAIDAGAMQFAGPDLPVPEVLDVGETLGLHYAISRRHHGHFMERSDVAQADAVRAALARLLAALRAVPAEAGTPVHWYEPQSRLTWHDRLLGGLRDDPSTTVHGWRPKLAADVRLDRLFRECEARIHLLLPACPERRDLVHGDLLHQNVLVGANGARVTGVFSWKCSEFGDFLYDVALCTFWSPWYPVMAAADMWQPTVAADDLSTSDLADAAERHHCFELQIGASHLGWCATIDDAESLAAVADRTEYVLERGPRR